MARQPRNLRGLQRFESARDLQKKIALLRSFFIEKDDQELVVFLWAGNPALCGVYSGSLPDLRQADRESARDLQKKIALLRSFLFTRRYGTNEIFLVRVVVRNSKNRIPAGN